VEHESLLQTIAQVAATFGGLAAVIAAVRGGFSHGTDHPFIVRDVVEISIIATILSLIPFVPTGFGLAEDLSWRICCAAALLLASMGFGSSLRRGWQMWRRRQVLLISTLTICAIFFFLLGGSAAGYFRQPDMIYIVLLLTLLAQAGVTFITILIPDSAPDGS
jgi:small-conductance mechanosensitive channel